jgi:hypothetical protein
MEEETTRSLRSQRYRSIDHFRNFCPHRYTWTGCHLNREPLETSGLKEGAVEE